MVIAAWEVVQPTNQERCRRILCLTLASNLSSGHFFR